MKKIIEIWRWYWGDGETPHPAIPPYTFRFILLGLILTILYKVFIFVFENI